MLKLKAPYLFKFLYWRQVSVLVSTNLNLEKLIAKFIFETFLKISRKNMPMVELQEHAFVCGVSKSLLPFCFTKRGRTNATILEIFKVYLSYREEKSEKFIK